MTWITLALLLIHGIILAAAASDISIHPHVESPRSSSLSSYDEHVLIQQFPDGKVLMVASHTRWIHHDDVWIDAYNGHFNLLPRSLGEAFIKHQIEEFQLVFTQGRWMYDKWGLTCSDSVQAAPSGVALSTVFKNVPDVDAAWKGFTHALSGLFCASLNFMDDAKTVAWSPLTGVRPWNGRHKASAVKLLPCQTKAGLASLYNSYKVYDANYHSLATSIVSACRDVDCAKTDLKFTQSLTVVLDPVRFHNSKDWSFSSLFHHKLSRSCPIANTSVIRLILPANELNPRYELLVEPDESIVDYENGTALFQYDFSQRNDLDIGIHWNDASVDYVTCANPSPISIRRSATGFGQERGGFHVKIVNHNPSSPIEITYYEYIQWFLKVYLHTYKVETHPHHSGILKALSVQPAIDRKRPTVLQARLLLPPNNSITELSFDFDMAFIKYTEHPPDAIRGFDVAPAIAIIHGTKFSNSTNSNDIRVYTEPILVSLPTPDFSMPYNVITMTCTLLALFFGSTFNMLTRNYVPIQVSSEALPSASASAS
ncbi:hypothetical protein SeLEV6574_g01564 [Synchytrium endobioticum]|uniref:Phosphatidylinositol glycan, class T n=1 Tax=Synchytrium endobioticum TaxID=286115 RepID=A0A507DEN0_9FUNG|nr:hypothetical protein SeLEV6574_g01564 [Synchytrium endobioticum]